MLSPCVSERRLCFISLQQKIWYTLALGVTPRHTAVGSFSAGNYVVAASWAADKTFINFGRAPRPSGRTTSLTGYTEFLFRAVLAQNSVVFSLVRLSARTIVGGGGVSSNWY